MSSSQERAFLLSELLKAYPRIFTVQMVEMFARRLAECDVQTLEFVLDDWIQKKADPPTVADLKERCELVETFWTQKDNE